MAISPIDYRLDLVDPINQAMQGYQQGMQVVAANNAIQAQKEEAERLRQAEIQKQVMNEDLYKFSNIPNKTAEDYANIIGRYPTLAEPYQKAWNMMDAERQKQTLGTASQVYAALSNGSNQVAKDIISEEIKGLENSGMKREAFNMQNILKLIDTNPQAAQSSIGMLMSSANPEQFKNVTDSLNSTQMQPYEIEESKSKTANNYSQITDRQEGRKLQKEEMYLNDDRYYAGLDQNEKQFWTKMNADERAAARAMAEKPETTTERLARLEKVNGYSGAVAQAKDAAENAARLAKLADSNGGAYWDRLVANIPGTSENTFRKDVETLKSQVFLTQIEQMRGLGALTESEGAALKSSIASLDLNQGATSFKNNLNKISLVLNRAAKKAEKNAELYATKGKGYSEEVVQAAKQRGISPAEMQTIANDLGW
ncbi:hypothetical protein [Acinetobacter sp. 'aerobic (ED)']|uniref:hypothetical protein n=1 Tax=Acinetobacter sp. 'aerobic (ED)' TaxID=174230 RepID=UPI00192ADE60|nr:hypothetical protein [Acinetobacter sp. 'aerobic (ED)']